MEFDCDAEAVYRGLSGGETREALREDVERSCWGVVVVDVDADFRKTRAGGNWETGGIVDVWTCGVLCWDVM